MSPLTVLVSQLNSYQLQQIRDFLFVSSNIDMSFIKSIKSKSEKLTFKYQSLNKYMEYSLFQCKLQ